MTVRRSIHGDSGLVTVIIPTRNRHQSVLKAVEACAIQREISKVVVVDDGSRPSLQIADFGPWADHVELLKNDTPRGSNFSRNRGARVATTEWLFFCDDDVVPEATYVEELLRTQERTGAQLVAGRIIYLQDGETREEATRRCSLLRKQPFDVDSFGADFSSPIEADVEALHLHNIVLVRRSVVDHIGWDTSIIRYPSFFRDDTDFFLRALKAGYKNYLSARALCFHLPPRESNEGGCRDTHPLLYEMGVALNNHRFLNRHYDFLKSRYAVNCSRYRLEYRILSRRWGWKALRAFYRRYRASSLYPFLHRLFARLKIRSTAPEPTPTTTRATNNR